MSEREEDVVQEMFNAKCGLRGVSDYLDNSEKFLEKELKNPYSFSKVYPGLMKGPMKSMYENLDFLERELSKLPNIYEQLKKRVDKLLSQIEAQNDDL